MRVHVALGVVMLASLVDGAAAGGQQPPLFDTNKRVHHSIESHAQSMGYAVTRHYVLTEDGYYLLYHQLNKGKPNPDYLPVLLQHGILNSSGSFMVFKFSLACLLADSGFDVWMGNARGNLYSRKHSKYDPDKNDKYWEFSFHEMGKYDLPAGIEYILKKTNKEQIYYVGFSMGTTMYFVMGATRPEYMPKVRAMIALAPVVRPKHMGLARNKVTFFLIRMLFKLLTWLGYDEMFPYSEQRTRFTEVFCNPHPHPSRLCKKLLGIILNKDSDHYDESMILSWFRIAPSGTSIRTMDHYLQMAHAGKFQQYDFGTKGNMKHYNSPNPPEYELRKVTSPIYLVWGKMDTLAAEEDVHWLMDQLPTRPSLITTTCSDFCHRDFMYGKNAEQLLNKIIVKNFQDQSVFSKTQVEEMESSLELVVQD